jgi:hypothetical protein
MAACTRNWALVQQWRTATSCFIIRQRWLSGVVKLGLSGDQDTGEGDVAEPRPIHWPGTLHSGIHVRSVTLCADGFSDHCRNCEIIWFIVWLVLSFCAPKHWLPNAPQWNKCLYLPLSTSQNKLLMSKCDSGCCLVFVLSHVNCHTGSPSYEAMPSHKMQTSLNK